MVYYGVLSKGCQRCRQRKIKCDQRRPACFRCEKARIPCPGFRNLADISFRDESQRIIRRASKHYGEAWAEHPKSPLEQTAVSPRMTTVFSPDVLKAPPSISVSRALSQPIDELGANFFFANYSLNEPPLSKGYHSWLTGMYRAEGTNYALRAAIEAAGMAGISNISYAPGVASRSKECYGRALAATKQALSDPVESVADTTLLTVILLGLFEFIMLEDWDRHRSWTAHVAGATTLLQLRGLSQFNYERGAQLYMQLRSQILYACVQRHLPVSKELLQINDSFTVSVMGQLRRMTQPEPLGHVCFRLLDLRAAIKSGDMTDPIAIYAEAVEMDRHLEAWRATLKPIWSYATVDVVEAPAGTHFEGKCHVYNNPWTAQVWNNWRTLRILVNRIIVQHDIYINVDDRVHEPFALSLIHQLSSEICISAPVFIGNARASGLIWPLSVVSQEPLNPRSQRYWAINQLRRITASIGMRQASSLADIISQDLDES